ncbi:MAG: hypothetical protein PHP37_01865 [Patescibacteria group bacterium]|nr:hypothetical protein [Patescibacteria group bacterium]
MKKLFVFFVFTFVAIICSAQVELEGNKEGVYRVKEDTQEWAPSKITAEYEAIKYINKFSQAISSPDTPILAERSEEVLKLKLIFKKLVEVKERFIFYNSQTNNIDYIETLPAEREESSYLILFSIASILLMVVSNILFKMGKCGFAALTAALTALTAAFALTAGTAVAVTAGTAVAVIAAAFVAIVASVVDDKDRKKYKVASIIFYVSIAVHIILLFT